MFIPPVGPILSSATMFQRLCIKSGIEYGWFSTIHYQPRLVLYTLPYEYTIVTEIENESIHLTY